MKKHLLFLVLAMSFLIPHFAEADSSKPTLIIDFGRTESNARWQQSAWKEVTGNARVAKRIADGEIDVFILPFSSASDAKLVALTQLYPYYYWMDRGNPKNAFDWMSLWLGDLNRSLADPAFVSDLNKRVKPWHDERGTGFRLDSDVEPILKKYGKLGERTMTMLLGNCPEMNDLMRGRMNRDELVGKVFYMDQNGQCHTGPVSDLE